MFFNQTVLECTLIGTFTKLLYYVMLMFFLLFIYQV